MVNERRDYDKKSRIIQVVEKSPNGTYRISYSYDFSGNPVTVMESQSANGINTNVKTSFAYDNTGRLRTEKVYVNNVEQASITYAYDELGRLATKEYAKGSWSTTEAMAYNIRSWLTGKTGSCFSMQLKYNDVLSSNSTPLYGGGVSEWTWQHSGGSNNMYSLKYDKAERLTGATQYIASGSNWNTAPSHYTENNITYDKNGNILTLQRSAGRSIVDNLTCNYSSGNKLSTLNESVTAPSRSA